MSNPIEQPQEPARQRLSALVDGALPPEQVADLMAAWSTDAEFRSRWHAYHVAGDVMRSDELTVAADRDAQFLTRLRGKLALEPVPMAATAWVDAEPAPLPAHDQTTVVAGPRGNAARQRWVVPAAVAAGFVAVAGVVVVMGVSPGRGLDPAQMAAAPSAASGLVRASGTTMLRDARLDRYMQAHRPQGHGQAVAGAAGEGAQIQIVLETR